MIYLLTLINDGYDVTELCESSVKIKTIHQSLIRKGLIVDGLTTIGKELIAFLGTEGDKPLEKKKPSVDEFETWWKAYPGTDNFTYKGIKYTGSRTLRQNKDECKIRWNKILLEGEYTAKQLTDALIYDVTQKKEASIKEKRNKLTFMQNSLTYLNQRSFEPFIELIGTNPKEETIGSTDI